MKRSVWSTVALSALVLGLGTTAPGCIGKRRPDGAQRKSAQQAKANARLIQPSDVDGAFDGMIEGERVLATYDEKDPARGAAIPLVTIVEYSDFQCPFCGSLAESLDDVMRDYDRDVKLVFKQFPLPMHAQAEPAARAALAAHEQGRFWEMHDALFSNPRGISDGQIEGYARGLGLDLEAFRKAYTNPETAAHVKAEMAQGSPLGVRGTPTFFINGIRHSGMMTPEQLRGLIDTELLAARALLTAGVKREEVYARLLHPAAVKAGADKPKPSAAPAETAKAPAPAGKPTPTPAPDKVEAEVEAKPYDGPRFPIQLGENRPQRGSKEALVTIVEFGAFDCEDCRSVHAPLQATLRKHAPDVRLVYRSLSTTPRARRSAQAAYAAHKQGKFWLVYDELMTNDVDLNTETAKELAAKFGLEPDAFATDLRGRGPGGAAQLLKEDQAALQAVGITDASAPLLFINGRQMKGPIDAAALEAAVIAEKARAKAFAAKNPTVDRKGLYEAMRAEWKTK